MSGWKAFEYSYLSNSHNLGYRPYIRVHVDVGGNYLDIYAIIDSGSQDTIISLELAPLFQIDTDKPTGTVAGVGGAGKPGYETDAILTFPDMDDVSIHSPVTFTDFPADMLLGQDVFFRNFDVLFRGREGIFSLRKNKNYSDEVN